MDCCLLELFPQRVIIIFDSRLLLKCYLQLLNKLLFFKAAKGVNCFVWLDGRITRVKLVPYSWLEQWLLFVDDLILRERSLFLFGEAVYFAIASCFFVLLI